MNAQMELKTLNLLMSSSTVGYFLKCHLGFLGLGGYDYNLLKVLDYALQSKRYSFINNLATLVESNPSISRDDFAKLLLQSFQLEAAKPANQIDSSSIKLLKKYINRYFDEHNLNYHISKISLVGAVATQHTLNERKNSRNKKSWYTLSACLLAFFVAIPEGILPVYTGGVFTLTNLLYVGLPAFSLSYFLFRADIYGLLKNFFLPSDSINTEDISYIKKYILNFLIVVVSLTFACLCFNSIYIPFAVIAHQITTNLNILVYVDIFRLCISLFFAGVAFLANLALLRSTAFKAYDELTNYFSTLKSNFKWKHLFFACILLATFGVSQYWVYTEVFKLLYGILD